MLYGRAPSSLIASTFLVMFVISWQRTTTRSRSIIGLLLVVRWPTIEHSHFACSHNARPLAASAWSGCSLVALEGSDGLFLGLLKPRLAHPENLPEFVIEMIDRVADGGGGWATNALPRLPSNGTGIGIPVSSHIYRKVKTLREPSHSQGSRSLQRVV